ncbi:MAG: maleylacetoacetate isomerase [Hyphomicrobiales bacterium]|nr:maleylacetoacetate isomerase [Hyphomicrobiales bacterium]
MTTLYILHGATRSSATWRVRIALNIKGVAYEERNLDLRAGQHQREDYLRLNPQGLVPALVSPEGAMIAQSMAIMEYLDEVHRQPPLLPPDAEGRARVRGLAQIVACDIHPINNMRVREHVRGLLGDEAMNLWMDKWSNAGFDALEAQLQASPLTGRFCHGDAPGMADACLVPQVANARLAGRDVAQWPRIAAIAAACDALDAFARARPA